jgi:hypothetical protein
VPSWAFCITRCPGSAVSSLSGVNDSGSFKWLLNTAGGVDSTMRRWRAIATGFRRRATDCCLEVRHHRNDRCRRSRIDCASRSRRIFTKRMVFFPRCVIQVQEEGARLRSRKTIEMEISTFGASKSLFFFRRFQRALRRTGGRQPEECPGALLRSATTQKPPIT